MTNQTDKDKWVSRERLHWASVFNVPMKREIPPNFPPPTLSIMRCMCALTVLHPGKEGQGILIKCLDRLFEAYWVEHVKTFEKDVLSGILREVLGEEESGKGVCVCFCFIPSSFTYEIQVGFGFVGLYDLHVSGG